jgi:hypothetical protein
VIFDGAFLGMKTSNGDFSSGLIGTNGNAIPMRVLMRQIKTNEGVTRSRFLLPGEEL